MNDMISYTHEYYGLLHNNNIIDCKKWYKCDCKEKITGTFCKGRLYFYLYAKKIDIFLSFFYCRSLVN